MALTEKEAKQKQAAKEKATKIVSVVTNDSKKHVEGFLDFIRTQGVIGLAIGLAVGVAASDTVKRIVEGFITQLFSLLLALKTN